MIKTWPLCNYTCLLEVVKTLGDKAWAPDVCAFAPLTLSLTPLRQGCVAQQRSQAPVNEALMRPNAPQQQSPIRWTIPQHSSQRQPHMCSEAKTSEIQINSWQNVSIDLEFLMQLYKLLTNRFYLRRSCLHPHLQPSLGRQWRNTHTPNNSRQAHIKT